MEELMNRLDILIDSLDKLDSVKELKQMNQLIEKDQDLKELLEEYSKTNKKELKERIIQQKNFQNYKEKETEINLLIMKINQELKKISKNGECNL